MAMSGLGLAYALDGNREAAEQVVADLEQLAGAVYVGPSNFAIVHGALGDMGRAFEWLERAYGERDMAMVHLASDVSFDSLRPDPRFDSFLERMGLHASEPS